MVELLCVRWMDYHKKIYTIYTILYIRLTNYAAIYSSVSEI